MYSTYLQFSPACREELCQCCADAVSYNYIWVKPVNCLINIFAQFSGDLYEYDKLRILDAYSEVAPGLEIEMKVYKDPSLSFNIGVPVFMNLGETLYIEAHIKKSPDPNLVLFLRKSVARPSVNNTRTYKLFESGDSLGKCDRQISVNFIKRAERDFAVFQMQTFRFCNIESKGVYLECDVTICAPDDTNAECTRDCFKLQHPVYPASKRSIGRQSGDSTRDYEMDAIPISIDAGELEGQTFEIRDEPYNISNNGKIYTVNKGVLLFVQNSPKGNDAPEGGVLEILIILTIVIMAVAVLLILIGGIIIFVLIKTRRNASKLKGDDVKI